MPVTIAVRIRALQQISVHELQKEYCRVFGEKTTATHKGFLLKKIAWKIQELEFGGITEEVKEKALAIVENLGLTGRIPSIKLKKKRKIITQSSFQDKRLPLPGTVIIRKYKDKQVAVQVLEDGFEYKGCKYRSLSAVAKAVTGSHWNGFSFFGIGQ